VVVVLVLVVPLGHSAVENAEVVVLLMRRVECLAVVENALVAVVVYLIYLIPIIGGYVVVVVQILQVKRTRNMVVAVLQDV